MTSIATSASARRALVVAQFAREQGGVVTRGQLLDIGFSANAIAAQLAARRWQTLHDGVYLTSTGEPGIVATRWGALLACGPGAVLSHESAAEVFGFAESTSGRGLIHVTIPESRKEVSPRGVQVHRSRLMPGKASLRDGFPVTTAADTVLDLAGSTRSESRVVSWITSACRSGATSPADVLRALAARKRQRHRALIKAICSDVVAGTDSLLEHAYLNRVERAHGLPQGRRQVVERMSKGHIRRDVEYDQYRTVVELDGRRGHEGVGQHRDMSRDNSTTVSGKQTLRYGHAPVMASACEVAQEVATVLKRQGWQGHLTPCGPGCRAMR